MFTFCFFCLFFLFVFLFIVDLFLFLSRLCPFLATMSNSMFARLVTDYEIRNQWFFAILEILEAVTTD